MLMIQLTALMAIIIILQTLHVMLVQLLYNIARNVRMAQFALSVQTTKLV